MTALKIPSIPTPIPFTPPLPFTAPIPFHFPSPFLFLPHPKIELLLINIIIASMEFQQLSQTGSIMMIILESLFHFRVVSLS